MSRRTCLTSMALICAGAPALAADAPLDLFSLDLEALQHIEVVAASREPSRLLTAPSVVTVVTDTEIRRRGLKTLKEVLDRVPGFLTMPDESTYLISNRGFTQNPNGNYLLMLDGQALNNQRNAGAEEYALFPFLFQVKRIEIIRGPGSTLWGADAAMGMINIVTYTADDLLQDEASNALRLTADYEAGAQRRLGSRSSLVVSLTGVRSDAPLSDIYSIGPSGSSLNPTQMDAYLPLGPSYELHAQLTLDALKFTGRIVHVNSHSTFGSSDHVPGLPDWRSTSDKLTHNYFLRADWSRPLGSDWRLDANAFGGSYRIEQRIRYLQYLPTEVYSDGSPFYRDGGLESVLTRSTKDNTLKLGLQWTRRDFRSQRAEVYNQLLPTASFQSLAGIENATGLFAENEYRGWTDWTLTLGLRHDHNDLRMAGSKLYPRFALAWAPAASRWSAKYSLNHGYVRPVIERMDGTPEKPIIFQNRTAQIGPARPQTAISNDLQFSYTAPRLTGSATLYSYKVVDYIARLGYQPGTLYQGLPIRYQNQNIGEIGGQGVELEAQWSVADALTLYGNLALARAAFRDQVVLLVDGSASFDIVKNMNYANPDRTTTGVPRRLWNLGLDWRLSDEQMLNLHWRGWARNTGKIASAPPAFANYGAEHFLDAALTWRHLGGQRGLTLSLYGKNLLDRAARYPQAPHGGYIVEGQRELGLQLSWRD